MNENQMAEIMRHIFYAVKEVYMPSELERDSRVMLADVQRIVHLVMQCSLE